MNHTSMLVAGIAALTFTATTASAEVVTMATGAQGSLAYNAGQAVGKVANDNGITARTQPLVGYLPLINNGEVDFGYSNAVEAAFALNGTGNYTRKNPNMRLVGVMFPLSTGLMAPCDLNLKSIADLKAKAAELRIASEYKSSTIIPFYIGGSLANGGMSYDDFKQIPVANFIAGIKALGDEQVDIALVSLNNGAGKQASVKLKDRGGLCYISQDDSEEGIANFKSFLPAGSIHTFKQNEKLNGLAGYGANLIRIPWMMLTNSDVSEELVYEITKIVAENKDALKKSFGLFNGANTSTMAPLNEVPYHPGALKYFEEAGIKVGS